MIEQSLYLDSTKVKTMKKLVVMFVVALIIFTSCSPAVRPYYETPIGRKKQDYYNKIQYGQKNHPKMKF
jgi:hypothetical protein